MRKDLHAIRNAAHGHELRSHVLCLTLKEGVTYLDPRFPGHRQPTTQEFDRWLNRSRQLVQD